jgi:small subunit ribosomal protein S20
LPNIKSSIRSVKTDAERNARNSSTKSAIKTAARKVSADAQAVALPALLGKAVSLIDKAVKKGVLHKNTAARKKSRLAKRANKLVK